MNTHPIDTHPLSPHELNACRALARLLAIHTEGWHEIEACDRHFDGGEWSGSAWADNWQSADEHCCQIIADRFGFPSAEYVQNLSYIYDNEGEHHFLTHLRQTSGDCRQEVM